MSTPNFDDVTPSEAKDTAQHIPFGWRLLFWGLIVWGAYYLWAYTPGLGGWQQAQDLEGAQPSSGLNVFATILFTGLATIAAVTMLLSLARRKKG